jgi:hypothetical protein
MSRLLRSSGRLGSSPGGTSPKPGAFHRASQQHRDALNEDLSRDDLTWEQRQFLHERFQQNVGQEFQKDSENKQFLERGLRTVAVSAGAAIALGARAVPPQARDSA